MSQYLFKITLQTEYVIFVRAIIAHFMVAPNFSFRFVSPGVIHVWLHSQGYEDSLRRVFLVHCIHLFRFLLCLQVRDLLKQAHARDTVQHFN
jgi:hypothetical protein